MIDLADNRAPIVFTRFNRACAIFVISLAIRWTYALLIFAAMGEAGLRTDDSATYLLQASQFASALRDGSVHGWLWLGFNPSTMPLYTWLLTAITWMFATWAPFTYVLIQGAIDAGTCVAVYRLAHEFNARYALPAAIAAAVNPTQIVLSGLVLTDTPFVFFVTLSLLAAVRWLRTPSLSCAFWLGVALALAGMIRILIAPWIYPLALFLLVSGWAIHHFRARFIAQIVIMLTIASIGIATVAIRNLAQYRILDLTPQTGAYWIGWVAPLVKETHDGTPWKRTFDELQERKHTRFGEPSSNPFEESQRSQEIAREELKTLGTFALLKAWVWGAAINIASPAIILAPPVSQLPRTGFFATAGNSFFDKIWNFLFRSDNVLYAWILQAGIFGVLIMRGIQFVGFIELFRDKRNLAIMLLFVGWVVFILLVNGPIASPKYRLPIEPVLMVLTGVGICALLERRKRNATRET